VLHEQCSNALVHGLGEGGTLTISARRVEGAAIVEVSDEGGNAADSSGTWMGDAIGTGEENSEDAAWSGAATSTAVRRGTGLFLVRELVRRELKGTVRLRRGLSGGTIATIEIPLDRADGWAAGAKS
jgi:two-component sensor histidine kinase